jgi:hypothetical protein
LTMSARMPDREFLQDTAFKNRDTYRPQRDHNFPEWS